MGGDETGDAKSSTDAVGAARQYSGALGGVGLCQVAVHLSLATPAGHAVIGRRLYLGADWAADDERRTLAGVPDELEFATKPDLAMTLILAAGVRAEYATADEVYGSVSFRTGCRALGLAYVVAVPANRYVTTPDRKRRTGADTVSLIPATPLGADAHRQRHQGRQGLRLGPAGRPSRRHPYRRQRGSGCQHRCR